MTRENISLLLSAISLMISFGSMRFLSNAVDKLSERSTELQSINPIKGDLIYGKAKRMETLDGWEFRYIDENGWYCVKSLDEHADVHVLCGETKEDLKIKR